MTQLVNEVLPYQQPIVGSTIVSAAWSAEPAGPVIAGQVDTNTTSTVTFMSAKTGSYVLSVALELASGSKPTGQIRIDVIEKKV